MPPLAVLQLALLLASAALALKGDLPRRQLQGCGADGVVVPSCQGGARDVVFMLDSACALCVVRADVRRARSIGVAGSIDVLRECA